MIVAHSAAELESFAGCVLVPTMGALHEGHLSLIDLAGRHAAQRNARVVVSIFVNPTQFNDPADLENYPRDLEKDAAMCAERGADVVYAPAADEVYPEGVGAFTPPPLPAVAVEPGLEDEHRPGHFAGVYAVVRRLFELTRCSAAVFGEKDWQQLRVVEEMVAREGLGVEIVAGAIVREASGLAMSSRNGRLSAPGGAKAAQVSAIMRAAIESGAPAVNMEGLVRRRLAEEGFGVEYAAVRDAHTLLSPRAGEPMRMLVVAMLEGVRLLDNMPVPAADRVS